MISRFVVGLAWSFITGLAGGWLLISPWALGEQATSGDWTNVTKAQFGAGAGLVVLAVLGALLLARQIGSSLREAGAPARRRTREAVEAPGGVSPDMEQVLIRLANALTADLSRQSPPPRPSPGQSAVGPPPGSPGARPPNGPPAPVPSWPASPEQAEARRRSIP